MTTESRAVTRRRARLTSQGQITVPKAVREALGARPGDEIEFVPRGGELHMELRPRRSILDFAGLAADRATRIPSSAEALDAAIERGMGDAALEQASGRSRARGSR